LPTFSFQQIPDPENRIFISVMAIDFVDIFNQVAVLDVSPHLAILYFRNIPGGVMNGSGNKLRKLDGLTHWVSPPLNAKRAACRKDRPP